LSQDDLFLVGEIALDEERGSQGRFVEFGRIALEEGVVSQVVPW